MVIERGPSPVVDTEAVKPRTPPRLAEAGRLVIVGVVGGVATPNTVPVSWETVGELELSRVAETHGGDPAE